MMEVLLKHLETLSGWTTGRFQGSEGSDGMQSEGQDMIPDYSAAGLRWGQSSTPRDVGIAPQEVQ